VVSGGRDIGGADTKGGATIGGESALNGDVAADAVMTMNLYALVEKRDNALEAVMLKNTR